MFEPLPAQFNFPKAEEQILEFWKEHDIFGKSLAIRRDAARFVFYEGPPTANGLPHPGHCLTRAIKDLFPRYQTMCGKLVERKAGWDTHGLPVEVEVCKELGIHTKEEIEAYGVEKFVQKCIESVFKYTREWEEMTRRLGFWVNLEDAYVTFHQSYVESVWWSLKTLFERGLLYQGHKIVWWWAQGGTALSAGEVGEGYRTVEDPSVYIRFPLVASAPRGRRCPHDDLPPGAKVALLVWTTTPWTLISNHFAAVGPDIDYSLVHDKTTNEYLYIAAALVETTAAKVKHDFQVIAACKGSELVGLRYRPPCPECYYERRDYEFPGTISRVVRVPGPLGEATGALRQSVDEQLSPSRIGTPTPAADPSKAAQRHLGWRVVTADFVTLDAGTGLVHEAPAYGEVDYELWQRESWEMFEGLPLLNAVAPDGTFTDEAPTQYRGRWVKDCDKEIIRELRDRGLLYHQELYKHEYPFCPRAEDDPLIQYARKSWFVRTSQFKQDFLANNNAIRWLPDHIQEGRFGDFLRNNVDWALSRERYWGTPLPIWVCEKTGKMEAIGSYAELLAKPGVQGTEVWEQAKKANPSLPDHLRVHKPYVDAITYDSPFAESEPERKRGTKSEPGAPATDSKPRMRRVPEVIDCWWDAGSMPFAQWGFPHAPQSVHAFTERFPCDFISEAIDQTRGWFYGLLSISTLLFGPAGALRALWVAEAAAQRGVITGNLVGDAAAELKRHIGLPTTSSGMTEGFVDVFKQQASSPLRPIEQNLQGQPGEDPVAVTKRFGAALQKLCGVDRVVGESAAIVKYPLPYKTCIVLGHVMGEDALKMSKRTKNYKDPSYIFDHYGADAMRWYFFSAQAPWTSVRFQEANIRDAQREFLLRLYNVFSFFNIYANIDAFGTLGTAPEEVAGQGKNVTAGGAQPTGFRSHADRGELDRWIISELHRTIKTVRDSMDRFENYPAAGRINEFVDALSNWYVRRSRDRFWRGEKDQDKWDAYNTLYEVLVTLSKLIAPFTPFFAEVMYQNLTGANGLGNKETNAAGNAPSAPFPPSHLPTFPPLSVHLCDYPVADESLIDEALAAEMDLVRQIVSLGRAARTDAKLKVRQPLAQVEIMLAHPEHTPWLEAHTDLIAEELNIKHVEFTAEADHYVSYQVKPDFKAIGPKLGKLAPKVAAALARLDAADARKTLAATGELAVEIDGQRVRLDAGDLQIRLQAKPGWSASQGRAGVVVVKTELTPELKDEGLVREVVHAVQALRKEQNLPYEARIAVFIQGPELLLDVIRRFESILRRECLADRIEFSAPADAQMQSVRVESHEARLAIVRL